MTAGRYDITIEQGSDFLKVIDVVSAGGTPLDLTDYTFLCAVRQTPEDVAPVLTITPVQDDLIANRLTIPAPAADTAAIPDTTSPVCFWDLQIISPDPDNVNTRLLEGIARFVPRIAS